SDDDHVVSLITPSAGLKIFLARNVALSCSAEWNIGGGEIYAYERIDDNSGSGKRTAFSANAGIKFLFF
ncbi:MAG: hypothetical protein JXN60_09395, partial [Lentisphaerae bacterium]|nr:hypothetical protein [Lentisphaerota bacterium]